MLPKKNRAGKKTVEAIFKACPPNGRDGKFLNSFHLTFKFMLTGNTSKQISFIVPKSVSKLAVKRNRLRRLGYSLLKKYIEGFPFGIQGVLVFKKYQDDPSILENEIKEIFNKVR
jgi:ribonuclease P protein component